MRVWFVTIGFPEVSEAFAGVEEVRALQRAGADVRVLTLRPRSKLTSKLLPQWGIRPRRTFPTIPCAHCRRAAAFVLTQPGKAAWTLAWLLGVSWRRPLLLARCLVLMPRLFEMFAAAQVQRAARLAPVLGALPGRAGDDGATLDAGYDGVDVPGRLRPAVRLSADGKLAKVADCVWTIAECNREQLATIGIDPAGVRVSFHGIDVDLVPTGCNSKDPAKIVTIGRLVRGKGMEYVLRAVAAASEHGADARLVVLGDGPDRARLEELATSLRAVEPRSVPRQRRPRGSVPGAADRGACSCSCRSGTRKGCRTW